MPEPARTVIRAYDYFAGDVVVSEGKGTGGLSKKKGVEGLFGRKRSDSRGFFALLIPFALLLALASFRYQPLWTALRTGRREPFRRIVRWIPFGRRIDTKLTLSHIAGIMERLLAAGMPMDQGVGRLRGPRYWSSTPESHAAGVRAGKKGLHAIGGVQG